MAAIEYRVVYRRDGRVQYREGFPMKNIRWGGYFHDIRAHEVIGWEERELLHPPQWKTSPESETNR